MKLFKYFNHSLISLEVFDPCFTLDKLHNKNIKIYNFKKIDKYHYSFITHNKNVKIIKNEFNSFKLIKKTGIINIIKNNLIRLSTIISIIISLLFFYTLNNLIMDININGDFSSLNSVIEKELLNYNLIKYKKRKTNEELLKIEKEIAIELYDLIEWIEIKNQGLNVEVRFLKRREAIKNVNTKKAIYSTKEGIVKNFNIEKGNKMVNINDYICPGQLLISGYIKDTKENEKFIGAKGSVYAYTWYNYSLSIDAKNKDEITVYTLLINQANEMIDKELTGDDEFIFNERLLYFKVIDDIGILKIHYTLVEDITR